ncbi:MAG: MFS transporter [Bauldia sp.]|nr:MFS transporter [Bauldia sp.]
MRNTWILLLANALNGSSGVVAISLGGLTGAYLLGPDKALATLPAAGYSVGLALGAYPAAILMQWIGRRFGFMSGTVFAVFGALLTIAAIEAGLFWLFVVGFAFIGVSSSFVQQYRFAAIESVPEARRGTAISRVMLGGILTALFAPPLVILTRDTLAPLPFAGAFAALALVAIIGLVVLSFLRFPPRPPRGTVKKEGRPLLVIIRQPRFIIALLCAAASFSVMTFVMTAAPLAMVGHSHSEAEAVLGIQWHVLAMFVPSFFTGRLIDRFGKDAVVSAGLLLLLASAGTALVGTGLAHFWIMLILLGVGWNFSFVGSTAMLSDTYAPFERGRVEGFNDSVVFAAVAVAALMAGRVLESGGWSSVNWIVLPLVGTVMLSLFILVYQSRGRRALAD